MKKNRELDVIDVHVTSNSNVVDCFSQYPLLDGDKKYTIEVTEFCCPLAGNGPLPLRELTGAEYLFEIRRKTVGAAPGHISTSLTTLPAPLGDPDRYAPAHVYAPGQFTDDNVIFKASPQRPMQTPGDMVYYLQRFFDDIRSIYITNTPFVGGDHGGGDDINLTAAIRFVDVIMNPNGVITLFLLPLFTRHFFLQFTDYGRTLLAFTDESLLLAYRTTGEGAIITGQSALIEAGVIVAGLTADTIEQPADYTIERHFDHRVRLEIESQMNTTTTVAWVTSGKQKMSHIIATFPISSDIQTTVLCNNEGAATTETEYQCELLVGDITWRKAEDKVSERYLLHDSQFFHNIRLEVFLVRKEWKQSTKEFTFAKEKLSFQDSESWTAKLRFRSI